MNAGVELFSYEGQQIRTMISDGDPWFVASDVARVLGYRDSANMTRRLDEEDRGTRSVSTPGGEQNMTVISEPGLYVAILGSQVEGARAFKRWVTHEVLPAIRKTGTYGTTDLASQVAQLTTEQWVGLATQLTHRAEIAEAKVEELEPAAEAWNEFMDADGCYDFNSVAKILGTGRVRLMARLREDHVLTRDNLPMQAHVDAGRFKVKVGRPWQKPDGSMHVSRSTRVTAKGVDWLASRYARVGTLVSIDGGNR